MTSTIKIGDKEIAMTANAATCYRYKQAFKKDLFQQLKNTQDLSVEVIQELAYVMHKQAAGEANTISTDDYMIWLEDFDPMEIAIASGDIVNIYAGQQATTSAAKKKAPRPSGS